jgi:hypothetical protein
VRVLMDLENTRIERSGNFTFGASILLGSDLRVASTVLCSAIALMQVVQRDLLRTRSCVIITVQFMPMLHR